MEALRLDLKNKLRNAQKIAVLGVGSELRGDDAAGVFIARGLESYRAQNGLDGRLKIILGATAPENFTGEIRRFAPSHLLIIDSADMGLAPGSAGLIDPSTVGGYSFCTHRMPVKIMADYLADSVKCDIIIIGIQPKTMNFNDALSKEVEDSARQVLQILKESLSNVN